MRVQDMHVLCWAPAMGHLTNLSRRGAGPPALSVQAGVESRLPLFATHLAIALSLYPCALLLTQLWRENSQETEAGRV